MTTLLFPGRHTVFTAYQVAYLRGVVQMPLHSLRFMDGLGPFDPSTDQIDRIVFAVTSSNQAYSRYSPLQFHFRAIGADRLGRQLEASLRTSFAVYGVPHYAPTDKFGAIVVKEIVEQSEQTEQLDPRSCVVMTGTPELIYQFRQLGYAILPAEFGERSEPIAPVKLLEKLVDIGEAWHTTTYVRNVLSATTFELWQDFPNIPRRIFRLWRDPLLTADGSLTESRDYKVYAAGMGNSGILKRKYEDIKPAIVPGKIVDEGCADGSMLTLIARDFPDSDLIGIEITGEFIARCLERQRLGHFGEAFIHFHQRNILQPLFAPGSIQTTICNSTIHELWSHADQASTVTSYLIEKFRQLARGGD